MFVKKLTLEHFGGFEYKSLNFCDFLNVIAGEDTRAAFAALNVALCNRLLRLQVSPYCFSEKSRVFAEIESNGAMYISETEYCADAADHSATRLYSGGRPLAGEECHALFRESLEEEECSYFINRYDYARYVPFKELEFSRKLAEYREAMRSEDRMSFAARTDGIGLTHTFRRELKKFYGEFLPREICSAKRLRLILNEDGVFSVKDVRLRSDLSRTEEVLFQFSCFLEVNRFWGEVQRTMGRTVNKPLYVTALVDNIDRGVAFSPFTAQLLSMGRQVFIFTADRGIGKRIEGLRTENAVNILF